MADFQQRLVTSILTPGQDDDFDPRGLAIYRNNLKASANRSLQISFPTVVKLIGEDLLQHCAEQLLLTSPPTKGDWALWGNGLPDYLAQLPALASYPFVADCARLDLARHQIERGADQSQDLTRINLLATTPLDQLRLSLNPNLAIIVSSFPVVDLYHAHQSDGEEAEQMFAQAQARLQQGEGQTALVYRTDLKARVRALTSNEQLWLELLGQGFTLGAALDEMENTDFALEQWLPQAIEQQLLLKLFAV